MLSFELIPFLVQGEPIELSQITDSDCDRMTPEEYQVRYKMHCCVH